MEFLIINRVLFIIVLAILINGCGDCDGCGDCEYEDFEETFKIQEIDSSVTTNYKILFVSSINPKFNFTLNQSFVKADLTEFDDAVMKNEEQLYLIRGNKITSGTCAPENIHQIELKN